ncbi:imelysin family protein [Aureispira sp. CCB-E]|uniref:imelysin family protein n=1 Tax=Aureispira sp. CCB-E TaxID=3051121 RepID=UPI002868EB0F|nr:imelysin family protein [Aureispira sp. CCB-E]WMX13982.1 imelysin family protein [Aureispira sp. CCB-E]
MRIVLKALMLLISVGLLNIVACKKQADFDKKSMLTGIINDYVLPSYQELQVDNQALEAACISFGNTRTMAQLEIMQNAWKKSMQSWSRVEMLVFGPGRTNYRYTQLDNTPIKSISIENSISDTTIIDSIYIAGRSSYTKGLASIEYLLFDENNDQVALLGLYQTDINKDRRFAYLLNCIKNTNALIRTIESEWRNAYGKTLSEGTGNTSQEGIASFSNAVVHMSQTLAAKKLAKPLGKESADQLVHPEYLESPYAHFSWDIILYNLQGIQQMFGTTERGLGSYLTYLINDETPTNRIVEQAKKVEILIKARQLTMLDDLTGDTAAVEEIYQEMRALYTDISNNISTYFSITILANPDDGD